MDLGAGTGILSLIMAQRFSIANIMALEIDGPSFEDCTNNFIRSKWKDRLTIIHDDLTNWSKNNTTEKFDLIISNPPYFSNNLKNKDQRKTTARHSEKLNTETMIHFVKTHLSANGRFAFIFPINEFNILALALKGDGFHPTHTCKISSFENSKAIRQMGVFSLGPNVTEEETQYLYDHNKARSNWYNKISNDFYIK